MKYCISILLIIFILFIKCDKNGSDPYVPDPVPTVPNAPNLTAPSDGSSTTDNTPYFNWSDPTYAVSYHIQIDDLSSFPSPVIDQTNLSNSSYTVSPTLSNDTWYWRVRAKNDAGAWGSWSSIWSFTVNTVSDPISPNTSITGGPSGTINYDDVQFTYTGSDNITSVSNLVYSYRLTGYSSSWSSYSGSTTKSYSNLSNGSYAFEVKAKDEAGNIDSSPASRSFTINVPDPVDSISPNTSITGGPSGTINYDDVQFTYTGSDNITSVSNLVYSYRLTGYSSSWSSYSGSTTKSYSNLSNGSYAFEVKAKDEAGNIDSSPASRSFTINVPDPVPSAPTLSSPSNGSTITDDTPYFNWNDPTYATGYHIQVDDASSFYSLVIEYTNLAGSNFNTPSNESLDSDTYYWRVRAHNSAGTWGDWSDVWHFTVDLPPVLLDVTVGAYADAYVSQELPNNNFGSEGTLAISSGGSGMMHSYIDFDIDWIPTGAIVDDAELRLYPVSLTDYGYVAVARASASWIESSITWNNAPGWVSPVVTSTPSGNNQWWEINVTSIVEEWVTNGDYNRGFFLEGSSGLIMVHSRNSGSSSYRPKLFVQYHIP